MIVGESRIIQGYKIQFPAAVKRLLRLEDTDKVEFVFEDERVYVRKKVGVLVRKFEQSPSVKEAPRW